MIFCVISKQGFGEEQAVSSQIASFLAMTAHIPQLLEILDPVESEVIGILKIVCATKFVIEGCAPNKNNIPLIKLFQYYKSRSTKGPIDDLSSFKGYIQTDGYSEYTYLASLQGITHLSCWAHARRYFDKAIRNDGERASHVMKLIQLLYANEALAREAEMSHGERHALRLEKSLPIINEIGAYIYRHKSSVTPLSPIGKAFEYCSNHWTSLQNYLVNGMLEIDSNLVENSIRPLALGRKNYLFAGSHGAAQNIAMFYSFFATCKSHNIDPQKWLTYVIKNINDTKTSRLKDLLPQFTDKNLIK